MPLFEAPPPAPPAAPPVALSAFEQFEAEFFGLVNPPSAPQQPFRPDANKTAAARMVARRQAEIRAQLLRDHQQAQAQAQLTAVAAQMQHEQQKKEKKEKKAHGVRMTCLRCGKNKPVNARNDGITCTECLRKKRRQESLALISSPPKGKPLAPPTPPPAPQMETRTFGNVPSDFELPPGLNFDAMGNPLAEGEEDTGKWRKSFNFF